MKNLKNKKMYCVSIHFYCLIRSLIRISNQISIPWEWLAMTMIFGSIIFDLWLWFALLPFDLIWIKYLNTNKNKLKRMNVLVKLLKNSNLKIIVPFNLTSFGNTKCGEKIHQSTNESIIGYITIANYYFQKLFQFDRINKSNQNYKNTSN